MNTINLDGKTILVAGAAGLLGKALVEKLLSAGANVLALDCNEHNLQSLEQVWQGETRLTCIVVDIAEAVSIRNALACAERKYGSVDGAINTIYPRNSNYGKKFFDVTYADFCENTTLHLGGYFLFMQQCAEYAVNKKTNFSLVNMSSVYGVIAPRFNIYAGTEMTMPVEYAAIKSALIHLSKYVTSYVNSSNFRVNVVSPGGLLDKQPELFLEAYKENTLGKGMLNVDDVAGPVLYLLSDAAQYINGQNLIVDDGFTL
ncbi:oxidoreductase [Stutzerimonas nitrititolerans]|uniref:oxidoreductase n=1 Tax=Stutzerimonas nitrititolerans TaxID=2482751 RepID=UPI00289FE431|nr:oxidoreductase [Stutzerimonas nitrititolerans]